MQVDRFFSPGEPLYQVLEELPNGAYTCDQDGLITYFNSSAAQLWGRSPRLNHDAERYNGSFKLQSATGSPIPHDRCWMARAIQEDTAFNGREIVVERQDGSCASTLAYANPIRDEAGHLIGGVNILVDVTQQKTIERQLQARERELAEANRRLRTALKGLLPICASCKNIRDEEGCWTQMEVYISAHCGVEFSHGICPDCARRLYPELFDEDGRIHS